MLRPVHDSSHLHTWLVSSQQLVEDPGQSYAKQPLGMQASLDASSTPRTTLCLHHAASTPPPGQQCSNCQTATK
eukprot:480455-Amphidinium_carterae.2